MTLREPIAGIFVLGALIAWGVSALGDKIVKDEMVQVCERFDETTTICRFVPIKDLQHFLPREGE